MSQKSFRGGRRRQAGRRRGRSNANVSNPVIPRGMFGVPSIPPRINGVMLSFETNDLLNQATALNPFNFSYFNVTNPLISKGGSATAVPFFTAYTGMYRKFRVRRFRVKACFANSEAFGVIPFVCPVNFLPTSTAPNNASYISNILCRKNGVLGGVGGNNVKNLFVQHTVASMSGFANTNVEDALVGLTDGTGSPSDNIYVVVGTDNNGAATVGGVLASVTVTFWIDFIERQTPPN